MRISGTEPSSVILSQTRQFKVVPHHKPHKILRFNFSENDISEKPPFHQYAWEI